jgi:hypothetical protein
MVQSRFLLGLHLLHTERREGKNDEADAYHSRKLSLFRFA